MPVLFLGKTNSKIFPQAKRAAQIGDHWLAGQSENLVEGPTQNVLATKA